MSLRLIEAWNLTHSTGISEIACVRKPTAQVVIGGPSGNVVDHKSARSTPVVRPGHSPKTLLACSVPDLQFDLLTGNLDDARAELDTDGVRTVGHDCKNTRDRLVIK